MWELFNSVRTGPEHAVSAAAAGPPVGLSRAGKLVSWERVLLKEVLRVTMLAQALALLCSSVVFLEQVVSGKLLRLFEVDHYISWKNQQAMERLLVPVGETLFCLREGHFIKPTTQGVQGKTQPHCLQKIRLGVLCPHGPHFARLPGVGVWYRGDLGAAEQLSCFWQLLAVSSSADAPFPISSTGDIEPCHLAEFWGLCLYWAEGSWSFPSSLDRDPPEGLTGGSCPAAAPL